MTARLLHNSELGTQHYAQCARRSRWPVLFVYRVPWYREDQDAEVNVLLHAESSSGDVFQMALEPHPHSHSASTAIVYAPLGRLSYELIMTDAVPTHALASGELPIVAMGCVDVRPPAVPVLMSPLPSKVSNLHSRQPTVTARVIRRDMSTASVEFTYEWLPEARDVFVVLPGLDCVRLARRVQPDGVTVYTACVPHVPYGRHAYRFHVLPRAPLTPRDAPTTLLGFDPTHSGAVLATWEQTLVVRPRLVRPATVRPTVIVALCAAAALAVISRIARARAHPLDDNNPHHPDR